VPAIWATPRRRSYWKNRSHDDLHRAQLSQAWSTISSKGGCRDEFRAPRARRA
jgi:hypothetical protein